MLMFCCMDKKGFVAFILVFLLLSSTCNASLVFHTRKLVTGEPSNSSTTPQVSPNTIPINESNRDTNQAHEGKPQVEKHKESPKSDQNNSKTPPPVDPNDGKPQEEKNIGSQTSDQNNSKTAAPIDSKASKKNDSASRDSGTPGSPDEKHDNKVDGGNGKAASATKPELGIDGSCRGYLTSCRVDKMLACIEATKGAGSKDVFLVVQNEGESTLKVDVSFPNSLKNVLPGFEVPKHDTVRMNISSIMGRSSKLVVRSGDAKCELQLFDPVSIDALIRQLSFYSKQVTPIYVAFAFFLLVLLSGGTWACCKLRKKSQMDGIPYQELEMGVPSAVNVDAAEGWDHDWDDDWDEDSAIKSPAAGLQVRNVSADGLTSRSAKKD